jgi:putative membrane protein
MSIFAAFLHHLCFVAIMLAVFAEMLLLKQPLTLASARKIQRYDAIYGISAALILIVGIVRVIYFEKGADYYLHSAPFIAKMVLFLMVGLLSIYPTMTFLKWNAPLKQDVLPEINATQVRTLRLLMHIEATLLLLMMLCAAAMAKGVGYFGH